MSNNNYTGKILWRLRWSIDGERFTKWYGTKKVAQATFDAHSLNKEVYDLQEPERVAASHSTPEALANFLNKLLDSAV